MKKSLLMLLAVLVCGVRSFGQMGGAGASPGMDNSMALLFSASPVFSATMQTQVGVTNAMIATSKMLFDHGNMRTEMNVADMQNSPFPPSYTAQIKAMGMDQLISIQPASNQSVYMIYPKLHAYFSISAPSSNGATNKLQTTKLGSETVSGHPCVKNMNTVIVNGQPENFTTWNATDLNNFPVQIALADQGTPITMTFQNISFDKVPASSFSPPAGYTKYGSPQEMIQAVMMSNPNAMPGAPRGSTPNQ